MVSPYGKKKKKLYKKESLDEDVKNRVNYFVGKRVTQFGLHQ